MKRIDFKTLLRFIFIGILLILYLIIGIIKWKYVLNLGFIDGDFLIYRSELTDLLKYKTTNTDFIKYVILNPKWVSIVIFGNIFLLLNMGLIFLIYSDKLYVRLTFWLFFYFSTLSFIVLLVAYLSKSFNYVAPVVARIKELQQSPFALIILIGIIEIIRTKELKNKLN